MPSQLNHYIVEYRMLESDSAAGLEAVIAALIAIDAKWQPWGSPFLHSHGATDFIHQAMVRYGAELA